MAINGLHGDERVDIVLVNTRGMALRPAGVAREGGSCLVSTRGIASGVYLLRVRQGKGIYICKVTIGP